MLIKKKKNFLLYIKKKSIKNKTKINKSCLHNNNISFKLNLIDYSKINKKKKKISQLEWKKNKFKKLFFLNRWETLKLLNNDLLFLIKKK